MESKAILSQKENGEFPEKVEETEKRPKLVLPEENRRQFERVFEIGMLKQLHAEKMLSDDQLSEGISMIQAMARKKYGI